MKDYEYLETKKLLEEEYGTTNPSNKEIVKGVLKELTNTHGQVRWVA